MKGIRFPDGYEEVLNSEAVASMLKIYGPEAVRVGSFGYIPGVKDGQKRAVALLWIDPSLGWLKGHFREITAVRLVELAEIGAQASLVMALHEEIITNVRMIGFRRTWAEFTEENPLKQFPVRPDDTIQIDLWDGCRSFMINPQDDLKGRYIEVEGECPMLCNGELIANSGGSAWVMGRKGKSWL